MTKPKRIMEKFRLDEISAVDYPAQEHARATIMKRDTEIPGNGKGADAADAANVDKGATMSEAITKALGLASTATEAEITKAIADAAKKLSDAEALAKSNEAILKMSGKHQDFMNGGGKMPKGGKDAFTAMSADERDAHIKDCGGDDESVEKMLKTGDAFKAANGTIVLKSKVGADVFAVLKSQNDDIAKQAAELAKRDEADAVSTFAKRATDLGFGADFGPTMRKAYSGDATAQAEVEKKIAGLNKQIEEGALFQSFGKSSPKAGSAEAEFMAKVDEFKKANPTLSHAQAYTRVLKARDNADIVKRLRTEQGAN